MQDVSLQKEYFLKNCYVLCHYVLTKCFPIKENHTHTQTPTQNVLVSRNYIKPKIIIVPKDDSIWQT